MKKKVAVIFGGQSAEHDVSIITAHRPIIDALLAGGEFEPVPVYIAKDGSWYSESVMNEMEFFSKGDIDSKLKKYKKVVIGFDDGLTIIKPGLMDQKIKIDVVFPAMHGTNGEDGSLMGLLRLSGTPFVGCDLSASAVAMDKVLTKQILAVQSVPVVPYVWFSKNDWARKQSSLLGAIEKLSFPLFVKPAHLGSSIGISKVKDQAGLLSAIEVGFHYDDKILVEEGVEDLIELTLPIIGNDKVETGLVERPLNKSDFFDFSEKYLSGGKSDGGVNNQYSEIPAQIDPEMEKQVLELGEKTYQALGCSGIARVDFLVDAGKNIVYVNEVNTLPGSLYQHNWRKKGLTGVELIGKLIALAEERFLVKQSIAQDFKTDILKMAGGSKNQTD